MLPSQQLASDDPQPSPLRQALQAIDRAARAWRVPPLAAATARGLIAGYDAHWRSGRWRAVEIEPVYALPIVNPATGRRSRTFWQAGRCDGVLTPNGERRYLLEVRTAGEEIQQAGAVFWRRMLIDERSSLLAVAGRQRGLAVAGTLADVVRRPEIRPRLVARGTNTDRAGTLREIEGQGTYFGQRLGRRGRGAAVDAHGRETPELFAARLAADTLRRPGWYFQRRVIRRSREQLAAEARELWQTAEEIRVCRRSGRHGRSPDACMRYGAACPFLPICCGRQSAESTGYRPLAQIHPELAVVPGGDQRAVLTPSRIRCFRLCRRRHYFRYEMGIVPVRELQSESLLVGGLIHRATAVWWRCLSRAE